RGRSPSRAGPGPGGAATLDPHGTLRPVHAAPDRRLRRLAHLARRDATRAHTHPLPNPRLRQYVCPPKIRKPATARLVVRVADVVAEGRSLRADITNASHLIPLALLFCVPCPAHVRRRAARESRALGKRRA